MFGPEEFVYLCVLAPWLHGIPALLVYYSIPIWKVFAKLLNNSNYPGVSVCCHSDRYVCACVCVFWSRSGKDSCSAVMWRDPFLYEAIVISNQWPSRMSGFIRRSLTVWRHSHLRGKKVRFIINISHNLSANLETYAESEREREKHTLRLYFFYFLF